MQPEVFEPLAPGEEAMRIQVDASELMATMAPADVRIWVLQEFLAYAKQCDYVITRGPEIATFHYPQNPGDPGIVVALGVGYPRLR